MHPTKTTRGCTRVVFLAVVVLASLGGCGTLPDGSRSPSTPYKGNAVWNIALPSPMPGPVARG